MLTEYYFCYFRMKYASYHVHVCLSSLLRVPIVYVLWTSLSVDLVCLDYTSAVVFCWWKLLIFQKVVIF
jgi:hypothetical protein